MKKDILEFLKRERDVLATELKQLQSGERRVVHLNSGLADITETHMKGLEERLLRFEELIAASESGLT